MIEARERSRLQLNGCATERSTTFHKKLTSLPVKTFRVFANIRDSNSKKAFSGQKDCRYLHQNFILVRMGKVSKHCF